MAVDPRGISAARPRLASMVVISALTLSAPSRSWTRLMPATACCQLSRPGAAAVAVVQVMRAVKRCRDVDLSAARRRRRMLRRPLIASFHFPALSS